MNQEKRMDYAIVAQVAMDWAMDESTADCLEHPLKDCEQAIRDLLEETSSLGEELVAEAARTAEEKLRADQMTEQHRMQCNMRAQLEGENLQLAMEGLANRDRIADLEAQLSAIGAGGVESLRKPAATESESPYATAEETASLMRAKPETPAEKLVNQMIEDRWLNEQGTSSGAYARGLFEIAVDLAANVQAAPTAPAAATLPEGWTACRIEHEPGYPEDVAFGPQIMMDRLKKWLDRHFAALAADKEQEEVCDLKTTMTPGSQLQERIDPATGSIVGYFTDEHALAAAPQAPAAPAEDAHVFTTPSPELNDLLRETTFLADEGANMDDAMLWHESLESVLALLAAPAAPAVDAQSQSLTWCATLDVAGGEMDDFLLAPRLAVPDGRHRLYALTHATTKNGGAE